MLRLASQNQEFDFDWNDYSTIARNQTKADGIAAEIKLIRRDDIDIQSQQQLGQLSYKLGTFYNHIKRAPDAALENLSIAEQIVVDEELAWTQNHIAFSYQQKFSAAKKSGDAKAAEKNRDFAIEYCNKVITRPKKDESKTESVKIVAFAYCVRALTEYENKQLDKALPSYRHALDLYEKQGLLDDQYARAKNRWAMMLAENKQVPEAAQAFRELDHYWAKRNDPLNPYSARFYVAYGEFLMQSPTTANNTKLALQKYRMAYRVSRNTEGDDSPFTKDIRKKVTDLYNHTMLKWTAVATVGAGLSFLLFKLGRNIISGDADMVSEYKPLGMKTPK